MSVSLNNAHMQEPASRAQVLIEGAVVSDPFGGRHENHVAVYLAERFAGMARNRAIIWAVARGDHDENEFSAHDGCRLDDPSRRLPPTRLTFGFRSSYVT